MLKVHPKLSSVFRQLTDAEMQQLTDNCIEGKSIRDPIVVWRDYIVDGHNRYEIAQKHGLNYVLHVLDPHMKEREVIQWMIKNHLGRRHLSDKEQSYFRGRLCTILSEQPDPAPAVATVLEVEGSHIKRPETLKEATDTVAEAYGVSPRTVRSDILYSSALDALPAEQREAVLHGKANIPKSEVIDSGIDPETLREKIARLLRSGHSPTVPDAPVPPASTPEESAPAPAPAAEEQRDASPAKAEPTKTVRDSIGRPVPKGLVHILTNGRQEFEAVLSDLKSIMKRCRALAQSKYGTFLSETVLISDLKNAIAQLEEAKPSCVCHCTKGCSQCHDSRWLPSRICKAIASTTKSKGT